MKKLENKTTELPFDKERAATYADLIATIVNSLPMEGVKLPEMRLRLKILDSVESGKDVIEFEDQYADHLRALVEGHSWTLIHPDLIRFGDDVKALKKQD